MKNIKKAGLIKRIKLKEADIFDKPILGKFDVITSDLPFGMLVSKYEDLENLYRCFIDYCREALNDGGTLAVYTAKGEMLREIISESEFEIIEKVELKFITAAKMYLYPGIFVCKFRNG